MADVFSVVALLIMFREALEAAIIISIMLQMCDRLQLQHAKKIGASRCCMYQFGPALFADTSLCCVQSGLERYPAAV